MSLQNAHTDQSNEASSAGGTDQAAPTPQAVRSPARKDLNGWTTEILKHFGALDIPGRDCTEGDLQRVHPLFHEHTFVLSGRDYERILPALRLASAFLYEPQASVFWYSFVFGPQQPVPHIVKDSNGEKREATEEPWSRFTALPVGPLEFRELEEFWQQMQQAIKIRFKDMSDSGASGWTENVRWFRSYPPGPLLLNGREARITLSRRFLLILRQVATPALIESLPHRLRQYHLLAVTLLHEICHAIHIVRYKDEFEPFFEDHGQAELGFAWEQTLLNGNINPVAEGKFGDDNALWGLRFLRWPDRWKSDVAHMLYRWPTLSPDWPITRVSRRHWSTQYLVTMDYVQALVTSHEWEEIAKYGPERLKMVKKYGLRHGVTGLDAWQHAQSSGASSQFKSENYTLWSADSHEKYRLVRRHGAGSAPIGQEMVDNPMHIDDPEDDTNNKKRRRSQSDPGDNVSEAGRDAKKPRFTTG